MFAAGTARGRGIPTEIARKKKQQQHSDSEGRERERR